jgi:peptide-methionine (R)-S-oxide reductase
MPSQSASTTERIAAHARRRRELLIGGALLLGVGSVGWERRSGAQAPAAGTHSAVQIENFSADGKSMGLAQVSKVVRTDAQWRSQLSELAFEVTRQAGTEQPFSGEYAELHAVGLYHCICCDTALYDSRTKFESGTGWPSFWQPISAHNVVQLADGSFGMDRTAISCRRCDAHLGHVFDDGPRPTGLRYCMNSVALHFVAHALA